MNEKIQEIWDKYKSAADGDYLYEGLFPQVVKEILAEAVRMVEERIR